MYHFIKQSAFVFLLAVGPAAMAENVARIEVHAISGGGGTSSGGSSVLSGTIGQAIGGVAGGGTVELKSGFHAATLELLLPEPDESFQTWMDGLAEEDQPPPDQRGPLDEPANDGVSNLLKYAFGLLPMVPSADAKPRVVVVTALDPLNVERDYLGIEFWRSADAAVVMELEKSDALSKWTTAPFTTGILEGPDAQGRERVRLLTGIIVKDLPKQFLRLRIETAPASNPSARPASSKS